jgi:uncharacterized membrane protein YhdT
MDNKQWSLTLAILGAATFCIGAFVGLFDYQIGFNFTMLSIPILLSAIWYELLLGYLIIK